MSVTPEELDRQLHEFMHCHRQTMQRFFSQCGLFNGHPLMLFLIRQTPGITPAAVARQMEITPASATVSIRRMEAAGLIRRQPDGEDRRVVRLYLTPQGEAIDDACSRGKDFTVDTLFAGFTPAQRQVLSDMLTRMRQNLAEASAENWLKENNVR